MSSKSHTVSSDYSTPSTTRTPLLCAYCDTEPAITKDHVIPRCLFVRPLPNPMITVPVCEACNGLKSKDDDFIRDYLVTDIYCSEHPVAKHLLQTKVARSAKTNRSHLSRAAKKQAKFEPIHSPGGIYLFHAYTVPVDSERINNYFRMVVRGLYYRMSNGKDRLPRNYTTAIRRIDNYKINHFLADFRKLKHLGPFGVGNVFKFMVMRTVEYPAATGWMMSFYDGFNIFAYTNPPDRVILS